MASRYEQFVAGQRKKAEQVREQALAGTLQPAASTGTSRAERFRAKQERLAAEDAANAPIRKLALDTTLSSVGAGSQPKIDMSPKPAAQPTVDFRADQERQRKLAPFQGKLPAPSALQLPPATIQDTLKDRVPAASLLQQTGRGPAAAPQTQYDITAAEIANGNAPALVKGYANTVNYLTQGNPVGKAFSRAFAGNSGATQRDSTGNVVVDKITDAINDFVTPILTPTGAPIGSGPNVGTYQAAEQALSSRGGQAAVSKIAQGISKVAPRVSPATAQRIAQTGLSESIAGPLQGVATGLANQQDSNEQIRNNALFGLAGGAALGFGGAAAGAGLRSALGKVFRRSGVPDAEVEQAVNEVLALPEGRGTARQTAAEGRSVLPSNDQPIINPTDWREPLLALPEASGPGPTRARRATLDNPYRTKFERLIAEAQQREFTPGREDIELENLWSQMAGRDDPGLDELINLAYPRRTTPAPQRGMIGAARTNQELRDVYGVGNPVRSAAEQYPTQVLGDAAAPRTVYARPGSAPRQRAPRSVGESIVQPAETRPELSMTAREQKIHNKPLSDWTQDDIDYLLERSREQVDAPATTPAPKVSEPLPINEPILRPGQFDEPSGLGIAAGQRVNPYDSLKTDTRSQLVSRQLREQPGLTVRADKLYTALVDDLHPLNQQDKLLERVMGEKLPSNQRIHDVGLASRGADVVSKRIITNNQVDSKGQVIGDSLKTILSPLRPLMRQNKHIYVDFEDYLLNKHALTRWERGEKVFRDDLAWTPDYGNQKVAEYEQMFPQFKQMADGLYEFQRKMAQAWLVDTGMISQNVLDAWTEANPYYVPNKRYFSELEKYGKSFTGNRRGYGNQSVPVKGYQKGGSQRKIISPIESMIENVDAFVKAAKRNQVMQQYVRNIERAPDDFADWAEIVKQPEKPEDIAKIAMDENGLEDILFRFSSDFDAAMQRTRLDKDNIVRALIDGEPVHVQIKDKQLLSALTALGPEQSGKVLAWVGKLTNTMKLLTTGNNPVFSLTRNLFRDIPQAYIASTTTDNPIGFAADLISAAVDIGLKRGAYKDFLNVGGGHASAIASDRNLLRQSKNAVLPQSGFNRARRSLWDGYNNLLNTVEAAPRLSEFKRVREQGGDLQAALMAAQDLTVNFKRRGALSGEVDKIFPYFNAALQGLDKTVRTYKDNPAKALTKSILAITIPSIAMYAINHDDPEYQKLSRKQKDAFLMIPKGDGTFFKVAKPQEQGTIFSDIPERLMQLFAEEDPAAFRDFADRLRTTFTPPGLQGALKKGGVTDKLLGAAGDTIFGPIADLAANKNFSGSAIVPAYLDNLSPELQYDAKTTNVSKKIGELTGTSPKQLDYLARQYTGFLGQFGQPLLSPGGDVGSALSQQVTADPVFSNDLSSEFYHYKDKLDQANADSDLKDLPEWYSDSLRKKLAKISKQMSAIRADMRDVQNDTSISNKDKRDELRKLQQSINDMAQRGNELARDKVPY